MSIAKAAAAKSPIKLAAAKAPAPKKSPAPAAKSTAGRGTVGPKAAKVAKKGDSGRREYTAEELEEQVIALATSIAEAFDAAMEYELARNKRTYIISGEVANIAGEDTASVKVFVLGKHLDAFRVVIVTADKAALWGTLDRKFGSLEDTAKFFSHLAAGDDAKAAKVPLYVRPERGSSKAADSAEDPELED